GGSWGVDPQDAWPLLFRKPRRQSQRCCPPACRYRHRSDRQGRCVLAFRRPTAPPLPTAQAPPPPLRKSARKIVSSFFAPAFITHGLMSRRAGIAPTL